MDFFERLRKLADDVPWGTFASVMSENLGASSVAAEEIVAQLKEWGSHLTKNALSKWTASIATPQPCDSPDVSSGRPKKCPSYAVVRCDVCLRPCCLAHARVDYLGDAICEVCIGEAKARRRANGTPPYSRPQAGAREEPRRQQAPPPEPPSPPGEMTVAQALRVLKLPKKASWNDIRSTYKSLVYEHNADRPQSDADREKNTKQLQKLNAAYAVLKARHEKREAA